MRSKKNWQRCYLLWYGSGHICMSFFFCLTYWSLKSSIIWGFFLSQTVPHVIPRATSVMNVNAEDIGEPQRLKLLDDLGQLILLFNCKVNIYIYMCAYMCICKVINLPFLKCKNSIYNNSIYSNTVTNKPTIIDIRKKDKTASRSYLPHFHPPNK